MDGSRAKPAGVSPGNSSMREVNIKCFHEMYGDLELDLLHVSEIEQNQAYHRDLLHVDSTCM